MFTFLGILLVLNISRMVVVLLLCNTSELEAV